MLRWLRARRAYRDAQRREAELRSRFWNEGLWKCPPLEVWDQIPPEIQSDLLRAGIVSIGDVWRRYHAEP